MNATFAHVFQSTTVCLILTVLAGAARAGQPDVGEENYQLPLVGRYGVCRGDSRVNPPADGGLYQLVENSSPADRSCWSWKTVVPNLEKVAVWGPVIVGKAGQGYFVFDTTQSDPAPGFFDSPEKWRSALRAMGLPGDLQPTSPDALAATRPGIVLRPWNYRVMRGLLSFSDQEWAGIGQWIGLVIALLIGMAWPRGSPAGLSAILGLVVNVVANIFIGGGGPDALVGFVLLPLLYCVAAIAGRGLRKLASRWQPAAV